MSTETAYRGSPLTDLKTEPHLSTVQRESAVAPSRQSRATKARGVQHFRGSARGLKVIRLKYSTDIARLNSLPENEPLPEKLREYLYQLHLAKLKDLVQHLALHAYPEDAVAASQPADHWAAEFLHIRESSLDQFLAAVDRSVLARTRVGRNLARAAGVLAFRMRQDNPQVAIKGSLRYDLIHNYSQEQREAFFRATAAQLVHSNAIEKVQIDEQAAMDAIREGLELPEPRGKAPKQPKQAKGNFATTEKIIISSSDRVMA